MRSPTGPRLCSPTSVATTDAPFSIVDPVIRFGGQDLVELTSFDLTLNINPRAPATLDPACRSFARSVYGAAAMSMNLTALCKSLAGLADFIAETRYALQVLAVDNAAEPKDFLAISVPNFTLYSVNPSAFTKQGGPRPETISSGPAWSASRRTPRTVSIRR
jgi:hypothetical protein